MTAGMVFDGRALIESNRAALSGKLVFGDPVQIAALRFLNRAQEYAEHLRECDACRCDSCCLRYMDVPRNIHYAALALEVMGPPADAYYGG